MKNYFYLPLTLIISVVSVYADFSVTSPDGRLKCTVTDGRLTYSIKWAEDNVINPSPINLRLKNAPAIGSGVKVIDYTVKEIDETSELVCGKTKYLHDVCNELTLFLKEKNEPFRRYSLVVRAYDEAIAFRLSLPRQEALQELEIESEDIYFQLQAGTAYALPLNAFDTSYETNYEILPIDEINENQLLGLPLLMQLASGLWVAISEADLCDYAGMYLSGVEDWNNYLVTELAPLKKDTTLCARIKTPHNLPWRVVMVAADPGVFIESDVIMNLSQPCKIENTAWIKSGKVVWPWWSDRVVKGRNFKGGMNTPTMKHYIDFAAENGIEYLLIDAEWYGQCNTPDEEITTMIDAIDIPELVNYAGARNVGVFLWVNWECVRDQMEKAFPLYEKWGIKGIKVDYMNLDDQDMVNYYWKVMKMAARYHLLVDMHGAYKPTGLRRAYPNLLTREGVLGLEWSKWSQCCNPDHELTIPFTRMIAGPMDFTPGGFRGSTKKSFKAQFTEPYVMGTRAHQLAMYVIYESPLQMLVDHPAAYFSQRGMDFLRAVPVTWDETRYIDGEVGDYIVLARRSGAEWYLGAMTDWSDRIVDVPLNFLGAGNYLAEIYADGANVRKNPNDIDCDIKTITQNDRLKLNLKSGGGCAIRFVPTF